jgi:Fic family protein
MPWIWEQPDWPSFRWRADALLEPLTRVRHEQGALLGRFEARGFDLRGQASVDTLTHDVTETSSIEGEQLDQAQVRSSIARRLGVDIGALTPADRHVEGVVEMTLDATSNYAAPLTLDRLWGWHAALFPSGRSGERVHYQAPPAATLPTQMAAFVDWFERPLALDPVLKAGIAHLWFVTVHPFEDGNGRIARAIADLALTRSEASPQRFYSMSAQIRRERATYYALLERTQSGSLDVTEWLLWFFECLGRALLDSRARLAGVLHKADFWARHADADLNSRQVAMLNRLLDGFDGKLSSSVWAKLSKCSQDTAGRDIADLVARGILRKGPEGGRSTHYLIAGGLGGVG